MTSFLLRHPRLASLLLLLIGALLAFANTLPTLHNDDIQQYFTVCNGGVGGMTPFALYSNVIFGYILDAVGAMFPGFNGYLASLLVVIPMALFTINEFVFRHRAWAQDGPLSGVWTWASVIFLCYINQECLRDQQVQYTHAALVAGAAAALVLYDALCGAAGWKRVAWGVALFVCMYLLRPESIMAFVFMGTGSLLAWWCGREGRRPARNGVYMVLAMALCMVACWGVNAATFASHEDWNVALDYRKTRVNIQDYRDNSGLDKSAALSAAGIDPVEFSVFKSFTYVPSMDDIAKLHTARDIHRQGCHGLLGVDKAVEVGLLQPEASVYADIFKDWVFLTSCVPFALVVLLFLVSPTRRSVRVILPVLLCIAAYSGVLLLAGRFGGRVLYPAMFMGTAWVLAFLPADARVGGWRVARWGLVALCVLVYAVCMRHYRLHSFDKHVEENAASICAAHPENLYLSLTVQKGPLYDSGLFGCTRSYWEQTNIVPISDGWIFYTPAYRNFLKARGVENPYLLATQPNVYFIVKDAGEDVPVLLLKVDELYHLYTGKRLSFRKVQEDRAISFWKAEETQPE